MLDFALIQQSLPELLEATLLTIQFLFIATILGVSLAIPLSLLQKSQNKFVSMAADAYVFFFRGTPLLVQIFLIYYGSGQYQSFFESIYLWQFFSEAYFCAMLALSLNTAAYLSEIIKGGINAVPAGEVEAAQAFAMTKSMTYRRIIFPRAFRIILPALNNEAIILLKSTSLVSTITLMDLMGTASTISADNFAPFELFITAGIIYLMISWILNIAFHRAEKRLNAYL